MILRALHRSPRARLLGALACSSVGLGLVASACDDSSPNATGGTSDAGPSVRLDSGGTSPGQDAGHEGGARTDAGPDASPVAVVTCKTIHEASPDLPSGMYAIDLDGTGDVFPSLTVYCDMTFDGGGWTMIQSFTGADSPGSLTVPGDSGVLVNAPQPGKLGGLADWIVKELAERSSQVHIRLSFASDAGADAGTWVTSRAPSGGEVTKVITNLRNLDVLTKGTDGGFDDWTGPEATAEKLSWVPMYGGGPNTCLNPVESTKYPSIYWACGNFSSMNLYAPQALCRWRYSPNTGNEPMEVFVR